MNFNEKLVSLRKQKGLSQETLGEKLNVARQTVSKWELGETTPEMDKLVKMSEIFEISLDSLMKDTEIETANSSDMTNTQKLAGIVILILKIIGVVIIVSIFLAIISTILFSLVRKENRIVEMNTKIIEEE